MRAWRTRRDTAVARAHREDELALRRYWQDQVMPDGREIKAQQSQRMVPLWWARRRWR
jgi:hypothetical protein